MAQERRKASLSILANTEKHQWEQLTREKQPGLERGATDRPGLIF